MSGHESRIMHRIAAAGQRLVKGVVDLVPRRKTDEIRTKYEFGPSLGLTLPRRRIKRMSAPGFNGEREMERRRRQIRKRQLRPENGLELD